MYHLREDMCSTKMLLPNLTFLVVFSSFIIHSDSLSIIEKPDIFIDILINYQPRASNRIIFLIDLARNTSRKIFHQEFVFIELIARIAMELSANTKLSLVIFPSRSSIKASHWNDHLCPFLSDVWNVTLPEDDYWGTNVNGEVKMIQSLLNDSNSHSRTMMILLSESLRYDEDAIRRLAWRLNKMHVMVFVLSDVNSDKYPHSMMFRRKNSRAEHIKKVNRMLRRVICYEHSYAGSQYPCTFSIYISKTPQKKNFCHLETKWKRQISQRTCQAKPCLNGGTCIQGIGKLVCKCPMNFFGQRCENTSKTSECSSNQCKNGATCFDREKGFTCCCSKGFSGRFCDRRASACGPENCFNGGTCKDTSTGFSCSCPTGFSGKRCEINLEYQTDFQAEFLGYTSQYITLRNERHLSAVTVAFWMKSNSKKQSQRGTPFSYSYRDPYTNKIEDNAFVLLDTNLFNFYLHGKRIMTDIVGNSDNQWHHCAITWESETGNWAIYWDGKMKVNGTRIGTGSRLWSGYFVIGQEQDSLGGSFSQRESYIGAISQFNVWDHAIPMNNIQLLKQSCGLAGNVLSWGDIRARKGEEPLSSLIKNKATDLCSDIGMCSENDCYCNRATLLRSQECWRSLVQSNCNPNPCANGQRCVDAGGSIQCSCEKGFEGMLCQYDIDECLINKGNCSEICINKNGTYSCSCKGKKGLASDQHKCIETAFCFHQSGDDSFVYDNGYTWEEDCKECKCNQGEVVCNTKRCPKNRCKSDEGNVLLPGECCKRCVAGVNYCNHSGRIYTNKDTWRSECSDCHCNNGEVICVTSSCPRVLCKQDETNTLLPWKCCRECIKKPSSCKLYGTEVNTFDKLKYQFSGWCRYTLVADSQNKEISIQYEISPYNRQEEAIIIRYRCTEVQIKSAGVALIENKKVNLPYKDKKFIYINASSDRNNVEFFVHIFNGMWIKWEFRSKIEISSPSTYSGRLYGLCGNFNERDNDDYPDSSMLHMVITDSSYQPAKACQFSTSDKPTSTSTSRSEIVIQGVSARFLADVILVSALNVFIWQHSVRM